MELHDIGWAVRHLQLGDKVHRQGWNGKGQHLLLVRPESTEKLPYVAIRTVQNTIVPWLCSQTDLLAEDWELAVINTAHD